MGMSEGSSEPVHLKVNMGIITFQRSVRLIDVYGKPVSPIKLSEADELAGRIALMQDFRLFAEHIENGQYLRRQLESTAHALIRPLMEHFTQEAYIGQEIKRLRDANK